MNISKDKIADALKIVRENHKNEPDDPLDGYRGSFILKLIGRVLTQLFDGEDIKEKGKKFKLAIINDKEFVTLKEFDSRHDGNLFHSGFCEAAGMTSDELLIYNIPQDLRLLEELRPRAFKEMVRTFKDLR